MTNPVANPETNPATNEAQSRPDPKFGVVGLGASAGGLRALQTFFERTAADSGFAYVVVMHLSPEHESHLASLLQTRTELSVTQVSEDTALKPDHVFVIPPNRNLATIDSHLRLRPLEEKRRERAPIDYFFRALAASHREQAVAVVLSGTGSDGSVGIREVKEAGGLTVAQDPAEAEYSAMPQSAINTGQTDLVLNVARMPEEFVKLADSRAALDLPADGESLGEDGRDTLQQIFSLIHNHTGHDFSPYKPSTVLRRLSRRMQLRQLEHLPEYADLLRRSPEEVHNLYQDLLITVTNFFRNPEAFEVLERKVIPKLFEGKKPGEQVRVWTVGCATGEEAYSLAMLLLETTKARGARAPEVQIFASDVSEEALAVAREGVYPEVITGDVSEARLERFFVPEPGGGYRVSKELRSRIVFARHNLLNDPPFSKLDLLVCRNMLIYLNRDIQNEVFNLFYYALRPEGYLFLGSSESLEDAERFRVVDKAQRLFQRRRVGRASLRLTKLPLSLPGEPLTEPGYAAKRPAAGGYGALHARLAERYAPPSVLVTNDYNVVHYSENAGRYLRLPGGEPTGDLLKQVRDELRSDLRAALHRAASSGAAVTSKPVSLLLEGAARQVTMTVQPLIEPDVEGFALVSFSEKGGDEKADRAVDDHETDHEAELEAELETSRERLRSVVEEHESYEEEMRAAYEELQSTNEELQSTAEELETSQEELQSINEELVTLNQENQHRVEELSQLTSDLQNLLAATDIATLFLDRDLRIKRFTPRVSELFNILNSDRGRPLADLTNKLGYSGLIGDAAEVLRTLQTTEREVKSSSGAWYLTRLLPYRTVDDHIDGVVITFVDISELKKAGETLQSLATELTVAEQRERNRIARILHDDIQQLLFAVLYKVKALRDSSAVADETLSASQDVIQQAISTARTLAVELSPPVLAGEGLAAMLRWLTAHMHELYKLDATLDLTLSDETPLAEERRVLLFHTARELLFNVVKHAPGAKVGLEAFSEDGNIVVIVTDKGDGFDVDAALSAQTRGFGLATLRQRLRLLGGGLEMSSVPGDGTKATITLPLEA